MGARSVTKIGKRGTIVIPAELRHRLAMEEGSHVIIEEREDGLSVRPAVALPVEIYSPERKAEFLLTGAVTKKDYRWAVKEVRGMGLDPCKIDHRKPPGV
ncbi:MAG: AbrB/MazE/SpoVT family DNA-binding domain-containing protein [Planctomycetes bacterium]|nr:AbrB/MazE/SpoVT family DNA-binding domain-containing protein [Planctomycetota bacterium]MCG2682825.1 AbrB/MazE/SpoVT family DNA-binding domain-containing protein [Planctomycetales bacterium]